jgi:hypothetical protein
VEWYTGWFGGRKRAATKEGVVRRRHRAVRLGRDERVKLGFRDGQRSASNDSERGREGLRMATGWMLLAGVAS